MPSAPGHRDDDAVARPLPPHAHGETLTIRTMPDPALKTRARPVGEQDRERVASLIPRMFRTMYEAPGIGLAATQVGIPLRLAVIDLAEDDGHQPLVLINPEIVASSEQTALREEGCLSLPGLYADIARPASVTVRHRDEHGTAHVLEAEGLLATCLQHEIDHLDGVMFIDHLSPLKRNMLLRKHAKEQRQKSAP